MDRMASPSPSASSSSSSSYVQQQPNGTSRSLTALNTMLNESDPNHPFGYSIHHSHVPPLPSPDTTAAAAALFRVNQMPSSHMLMSPTESSYENKLTLERYEENERQRGYYKGKRQRNTTSLSFSNYDQKTAIVPLEPLAIPSNTMVTPIETIARTVSAPSSLPSLTLDPISNNMNKSNVNPKRNVGIPKFLRFLFQMLEQEDGTIIAWSHQGTAFQIKQPELLSQKILPKYFKHNKVSSFQRQLNYFGFKKWTKTQTTICTFSHPSFRRDDREKMMMIKRNERVKGEETEPEREEEKKENKKRMRHVVREDDDEEERISSESIARMLRPTISPSSTAASASMVSLATSIPSSSSFGRVVEPYQESSADGLHSHRTRRPSVFEMSHPSSQWTSTPLPPTDPYHMDPSSSSSSVYDPDPMGMLMNGSMPLERSTPSSSTDYLDVLLESATMEESSSSDATPPTSWEAACEPHPLHPPQRQQQMLTASSTFQYPSQTSHPHRRYE